MSFWDSLGTAFDSMTDKVTGKNQLTVVQKQQAQQDQVIDLERQRLALLSSTLSPTNSGNAMVWVGVVLGLVVIGALVYFFVIKKKKAA